MCMLEMDVFRMDDLMKQDDGREELSTLTRAATSGKSSLGPYASPSVELTSNGVSHHKVGDTPNLKSNKRNRSGQNMEEEPVGNGEGRVKKGEADSETGHQVPEEESSGSSGSSPCSARDSKGGGWSVDSRETNAQSQARKVEGNEKGKDEKSPSGVPETESRRQQGVVASKVECEDDDEDQPYVLGDEDDDDLWQPDEVGYGTQ